MKSRVNCTFHAGPLRITRVQPREKNRITQRRLHASMIFFQSCQLPSGTNTTWITPANETNFKRAQSLSLVSTRLPSSATVQGPIRASRSYYCSKRLYTPTCDYVYGKFLAANTVRSVILNFYRALANGVRGKSVRKCAVTGNNKGRTNPALDCRSKTRVDVR
jgi:hypothetical protein